MPSADASLSPSPLGRSLRLVDGDLVFDAQGTLELVRGTENFLQSMRLAVLTPLGDDLVDVRYGFDFESTFAIPGMMREVKEVIRLNLVRTLSRDDRVRSIREVVFGDEPRYAELVRGAGAAVEASGSASRRHWRAVAVLDVTTEGDLPVPLSGLHP